MNDSYLANRYIYLTLETPVMLTSIIVDDELKSRESLKQILLTFCDDVNVVATCQNVTDGLTALEEHKPDLVFLDIQMQGETGFDLLAKLKSVDFALIFTTAHSEYAIKAIKFSALDYLLKPIDVEELQQALSKVKERKNGNMVDRLAHLVQNMKSANLENYKLALPTAEGLSFVKVSEILYLKASGNYTEIFMRDGQKHLVSRHLKEYDDLLADHNFFRIHHSTLININFIKNYVRGEGGYVVMSDSSSLDVSRRKKDAFLEKIGYK
jgi:two-component system, LytTR family, response regulator